MRPWATLLLCGALLTGSLPVLAQGAGLNLPKKVQAGDSFTIQTTGNGPATLLFFGPGQVLKKDIQLGGDVDFPGGTLSDAGHYLVILTQEQEVESGSFDVTPVASPGRLSFLAKPSRLPVGLHDGITGEVYVFDVYGNLIVTPTQVEFDVLDPSGSQQKYSAKTHDGVAWTQFASTGKQGNDQFVARAGEISSTSVVRQVPGDPCGLKMSAQQSGEQLQLKTAPVVDCSGNAVLDGTIVTFTESYEGGQSTADVPLKHGIAEITLPAHRGATLSVASGVALGNQIRWEQ